MIDLLKVKPGQTQLVLAKDVMSLKKGTVILVLEIEAFIRDNNITGYVYFTCCGGEYKLIADYFEPHTPEPEAPKPADSFKPGEYKTSEGRIVEAIAKHNDTVWIDDCGVYEFYKANSLAPLTKFDHLCEVREEK